MSGKQITVLLLLVFFFIFYCINKLCSCWFVIIICWTLIHISETKTAESSLNKEKIRDQYLWNVLCFTNIMILSRFLPSTFYSIYYLFELPYLPVYKSTFYSLQICPKNRPRLIHGSKTEIKKSSGQISIIIVSYGNKHPLLHSTSYGVFSLINLSSWS